MAQGSDSTSSAAMISNGVNVTGCGYECSVCLEGLDAPAPITQAGAIQTEVSSRSELNGKSHYRRNQLEPHKTSPAAGTSSGSDTTAEGSDVHLVATTCGHVYHQTCLNQWFRQNKGQRTCPGCRKRLYSSRIIRLYPSRSGIPSVHIATEHGAASDTNAAINESDDESEDGGDLCLKESCLDLRALVNVLKSDSKKLQETNRDLMENGAIHNAQISSLEDELRRKEYRIAQLERELECFLARQEVHRPVRPSSPGSKRRRRH